MAIGARSSTYLDKQIGWRLRLARIVRGISMKKLSDYANIAMQQVHKYEIGADRIPVSRLMVMARILAVPIEWFFDISDRPLASILNGNVHIRATAMFLRLFVSIKDAEKRKSLLRAVQRERRTSRIISRTTKGRNKIRGCPK
jgi:transcriptional regulator with XRE-family HTH domain